MWYAAYILTMPTRNVHVPNVRADSGVTGELCDSAVLDSCTVGLLAAGAEVGSDKVVVVLMGFVDEEVEVGC
jgi:hypothetical protein